MATLGKLSTNMPDEFIEMMNDQYPIALAKLKRYAHNILNNNFAHSKERSFPETRISSPC